ncbi:MAG: 50S ribosomal protein L5 [Patescibacteria group bacterium]|nr:MAG: 50S ribosomal protein L5 [Patescibacteria group bacterium]
MLNIEEKYKNEVVKKLMEEFEIKNPLAVPSIEKVVVNVGAGEAIKNKDIIDSWSRDLATITGQKPSVRKARISVSAFGVRKGAPVGLKCTLRGKRAFSFLERLFAIVLPRLNDFRGVPIDSFDREGNYTLGLSDFTIFPEIDVSKVTKPFGLEITIVTTTKNKEMSKRLLELLGMPFEKKN